MLDMVKHETERIDSRFLEPACGMGNFLAEILTRKLGRIPVLKARMNADLHLAEDLKNTGKGNLFVVFGEPDIALLPESDGKLRVN